LGQFSTFWAIFNKEQFVITFGSISHRKGHVLNLTKAGLGDILGDIWRPLGDFWQKHLVTLLGSFPLMAAIT
jgi:hypothetical protein